MLEFLREGTLVVIGAVSFIFFLVGLIPLSALVDTLVGDKPLEIRVCAFHLVVSTVLVAQFIFLMLYWNVL